MHSSALDALLDQIFDFEVFTLFKHDTKPSILLQDMEKSISAIIKASGCVFVGSSAVLKAQTPF